MISADLLRRLRNDLPMPVTIAALGRDGPPVENERRLLPLPLPTLRRNARHRQPTQQPRPLFLLQEKPQQHRPAPDPRLRLPSMPSASSNAGSTNTRPSKPKSKQPPKPMRATVNSPQRHVADLSPTFSNNSTFHGANTHTAFHLATTAIRIRFGAIGLLQNSQ